MTNEKKILDPGLEKLIFGHWSESVWPNYVPSVLLLYRNNTSNRCIHAITSIKMVIHIRTYIHHHYYGNPPQISTKQHKKYNINVYHFIVWHSVLRKSICICEYISTYLYTQHIYLWWANYSGPRWSKNNYGKIVIIYVNCLRR